MNCDYIPVFDPEPPVGEWGWPAAACPCQNLIDQVVLTEVLLDLVADDEGLILLADVLRVLDEAGETG